MATPQDRPGRTVTDDTVRALVPYSGYPLAEDRVDMHVDGISQLLGITSEWDGLPLAYQFGAGEFGNAPIQAQYWATWRSSRQKARGA